MYLNNNIRILFVNCRATIISEYLHSDVAIHIELSILSELNIRMISIYDLSLNTIRRYEHLKK